MLDKELPYIALLPLGSLLWMLGGWKWKGWRRFVLPLLLLGFCLACSVGVVKAILVSLICAMSTSLPYGENSSWLERVMTSITFGIIGIPLGLTWYMILPPIVFILGWIASNSRLKVQWKIIEGCVGLVTMIPIASLLYGYIR